MVYTYSLGQMCVAEGVGMTLIIYLGESIIANELLAQTHGHEMGWVWVALGFGFAFGLNIATFNFVSASFNPAMVTARWVIGRFNGTEWITLIGCEFLGGFIGAVFVWLHYLPHFKTLPEPPATTAMEALLRPRDCLGPGGLNIAGYNTDERVLRGTPGAGRPRMLFQDAAYYLRRDAYKAEESKVLKPTELRTPGGLERRRSVQVADLQHRLDSVILQPAEVAADKHAAAHDMAQRNGANATGAEADHPIVPTAADIEVDGALPLTGVSRQLTEQEMAMYKAALRADQNAKLSIFATRPAIYSPVFNLLHEFLATMILIVGALLIIARGEQIYQSAVGLWAPIEGIYVGFFVFVVVVCFGGPTGVALNIARDTAPRLAHFLLPIPNKGPSEWYYAPIPFIGSLVGGAAAGGMYLLINDNLNLSIVESTAPIIV